MINNKYSSNYFFGLSEKEKEELQSLLDFYVSNNDNVNIKKEELEKIVNEYKKIKNTNSILSEDRDYSFRKKIDIYIKKELSENNYESFDLTVNPEGKNSFRNGYVSYNSENLYTESKKTIENYKEELERKKSFYNMISKIPIVKNLLNEKNMEKDIDRIKYKIESTHMEDLYNISLLKGENVRIFNEFLYNLQVSEEALISEKIKDIFDDYQYKRYLYGSIGSLEVLNNGEIIYDNPFESQSDFLDLQIEYINLIKDMRYENLTINLMHNMEKEYKQFSEQKKDISMLPTINCMEYLMQQMIEQKTQLGNKIFISNNERDVELYNENYAKFTEINIILSPEYDLLVPKDLSINKMIENIERFKFLDENKENLNDTEFIEYYSKVGQILENKLNQSYDMDKLINTYKECNELIEKRLENLIYNKKYDVIAEIVKNDDFIFRNEKICEYINEGIDEYINKNLNENNFLNIADIIKKYDINENQKEKIENTFISFVTEKIKEDDFKTLFTLAKNKPQLFGSKVIEEILIQEKEEHHSLDDSLRIKDIVERNENCSTKKTNIFYEKIKEQVNNIKRENEIELTPSLSY